MLLILLLSFSFDLFLILFCCLIYPYSLQIHSVAYRWGFLVRMKYSFFPQFSKISIPNFCKLANRVCVDSFHYLSCMSLSLAMLFSRPLYGKYVLYVLYCVGGEKMSLPDKKKMIDLQKTEEITNFY